MNINQNINKLLLALKQKGQLYKINTFKFYSEKTGKYCTKYQVLAQVDIPKFNEETNEMEIEKKYIQTIECYNQIDLVKFLSSEYKEIGSEADEK